MSCCKLALLCGQFGHYYSYTGTQVKCLDVYGELCFAAKEGDFNVSEPAPVQISVEQELVQQGAV